MSFDITRGSGPHVGQKIWAAGAPVAEAAGAVIMLHGRGATAPDILSLSDHLGGRDVAFLAPQAKDHAWYPQRFMMPRASNQPWLASALSVVQGIVDDLMAGGMAERSIALLGFSQGACLALESGVRIPQRFGALIGLSGGLIGADDELWDGATPMSEMPVFLGCSERDPHIPLARVEATAERFGKAGATVTKRIYGGSDHTVNVDEINHAAALIARLDATGRPAREVRHDRPTEDDAVPEVYVYAAEGRSIDQKRALVKDITDAVVKNFGAPRDAVVVQIVEAPLHNKAKGGVLFSER